MRGLYNTKKENNCKQEIKKTQEKNSRNLNSKRMWNKKIMTPLLLWVKTLIALITWVQVRS